MEDFDKLHTRKEGIEKTQYQQIFKEGFKAGEQKGLKELHDFVAQRGAGAQYALESDAYSKVLEKIEELEKHG